MDIITATDSYKVSHHRQNPPGIKYKSSYIEARGGAFGYTVFFGLQKYLEELSFGAFYPDMREADTLFKTHMGVENTKGWEHIITKYKGDLPLLIEAIPEGTPVPHGTPMVQVWNTDPECAWLPAYIETALLRSIWYPSTVATLSREIKKVIKDALEKTGDVAGLPFKLHDFGARGVSSGESAGIGGMGHLVNFMGTDTVEALIMSKKYYKEPCAGFSIPASEHSTATAWGRNREADYVRHMIREFGGKGKLVAVVADSYNVFNFTDKVMEAIKDELIASGTTLVVRPDSGNPPEVVVHVLNNLRRVFGGTLNGKGYWVLPPCIRVIQGDGVNYDSIKDVITAVIANKYSMDNLAFGMGGALLQQVNRDTHKFAMKTSAVSEDGINWTGVSKDPITDQGKKSKVGIQKHPLLRPVWREGKFIEPKTTFAEVRKRAEI